MPGKYPTVGFETEFFTINERGNLVNKVDWLMALLKTKRRVHSHLREEVFHSMLEIGAHPGRSMAKVWSRYLENLQKVIDTAEEDGLRLLPLSTYPGKSRPKMRKRAWYAAQSKFLGKQLFSRAIRICAFHSHYSLPKGVIGKNIRQIRRLRYSRAKDIFLNQYNFLVATDPACITFCQSSPYTEGEHFAKDSRTMLYRDMALEEKGKQVYGLFEQHPLFGGLPNYEYTLADLRNMSAKRKRKFLEMMRAKGLEVPAKLRNRSDLRFMFGAVRVNRVGTIEYRGTDMNYPSYMLATSYLIKLAFDEIKKQNLQMLPSDIGLTEPFKREGDTVYLPPFYQVKRLERLSTLRGMMSKRLANYSSALVSFVLRTAKRKDMKRLAPISHMLQTKKTISDEILEYVKKQGYETGKVPNEVLAQVSLDSSVRLSKDVEKTLKLLSR
ncbi:hypothetical protein GF412_02435 [Candidatus Micrarchaeota archaeon]|nr:hypothetical protein [Candidatus Micrarchaeota archaeon]MBD3417816.1 hypothetical protein [Candidatus Micrarchaeota archaeon]